MSTKRVLIGTVVAGITMFLLGWLIYGMLLMDFMSANCDQTMSRPPEEMIMWAIALSNLVSGLMLSLVLDWSGRLTAGGGAKTGAILGFLIALSFDLAMYSMTTMFSNASVIVVDTIASCVLFTIAGAVTGWAMGKWGGAATA
jgi:hypothetical protein